MNKKFLTLLLTAVCCLMGTQAWATNVATEDELQSILSSGGTATLTKNITLTKNLAMGMYTTATIDLGTDTIKSNGYYLNMDFGSNLTVTGTTGGIVGGSSCFFWSGSSTQWAKLTITGGHYKATTRPIIYFLGPENTVNISGGTFEGASNYANGVAVLYAGGESADINISGGKFSATTNACYLIYVGYNHSQKLTISGNPEFDYTYNGTNTTSAGPNSNNYWYSTVAFSHSSGYYNDVLTISGGTFKFKKADNVAAYNEYGKESCQALFVNGSVKSLNITGGTYESDATSMRLNSIASSPVSISSCTMTGSTYCGLYVSGHTGQTFNISDNDISGTGGGIYVSGSWVSEKEDYVGDPSVYVQSGTFNVSGWAVHQFGGMTHVGNLTVNGAGGGACCVSGKMWISGQFITASETAAKNSGGVLRIIDGAELNGTNNAALWCTGGTTYVTGGTLISNTKGIYSEAGTVKVSGGTITGGNYGVYNQGGNVTISGGKFKATDASGYSTYNANGTLLIKHNNTAGTDIFNIKPNKSANITIEEGYTVVDNSDAATKVDYPYALGAGIDFYPGSEDMQKATQDQPTWSEVRTTEPNSVGVVDNSTDAQTFAGNNTNIIVHNGDNYVCPNFVLTDLSEWGSKDASTAAQTDFYTPSAFTAIAGSYKRSFIAGYNSICVPFDLKVGDFEANQVLVYSSYDENAKVVYFKYATADKNNVLVSAGKPAIIKLDVAIPDKEFNLAGRTIKKDGPLTGEPSKGSFQTSSVELSEGYFGLDTKGVFHPLYGNIYPFRAAFQLNGATSGSGAAPRLVIMNVEQDQTVTGMDELNAQGQNEKFFQNGKLMIRHNGQLFNAAGQLVK